MYMEEESGGFLRHTGNVLVPKGISFDYYFFRARVAQRQRRLT